MRRRQKEQEPFAIIAELERMTVQVAHIEAEVEYLTAENERLRAQLAAQECPVCRKIRLQGEPRP